MASAVAQRGAVNNNNANANISPTAAAAASVVKFNDLHDIPFGALSPLSPHPITVRHVEYPSVNHYFQSQRFAGSPSHARIAAAPSLWELDRLVRAAESNGHEVSGWDDLKTDAMLLGNYYKFKQNPDAKAALLSGTSGRVILYRAADPFWGDGGDGASGRNLLGVVLMSVRKRITAEEGPSSSGGAARRAGR